MRSDDPAIVAPKAESAGVAPETVAAMLPAARLACRKDSGGRLCRDSGHQLARSFGPERSLITEVVDADTLRRYADVGHLQISLQARSQGFAAWHQGHLNL
jgi:hypothetical protein